jgi:hypothetical protein
MVRWQSTVSRQHAITVTSQSRTGHARGITDKCAATPCFQWRPGYPIRRPRSYRRKIAFLIMAVIKNDIRANFEQRCRLDLRDSNKSSIVCDSARNLGSSDISVGQ